VPILKIIKNKNEMLAYISLKDFFQQKGRKKGEKQRKRRGKSEMEKRKREMKFNEPQLVTLYVIFEDAIRPSFCRVEY
jgi:hypothetical protein